MALPKGRSGVHRAPVDVWSQNAGGGRSLPNCELLCNGQIQNHPSFLRCRRVGLPCVMHGLPRLQSRAKCRRDPYPCRDVCAPSCKATMKSDISSANCDKQRSSRPDTGQLCDRVYNFCSILRELRNIVGKLCDRRSPFRDIMRRRRYKERENHGSRGRLCVIRSSQAKWDRESDSSVQGESRNPFVLCYIVRDLSLPEPDLCYKEAGPRRGAQGGALVYDE